MIVDVSGSMSDIKSDIIGSINSFIEQQQQIIDDSIFTLIKFNDDMTTILEKVPMSSVKKINQSEYIPMGNTALNDSIGVTINKYNSEKNVCMVIVTDGEENASRDFWHEQIREMISKKQLEGWKFIYLSTDITTAKQGTNIGIYSTQQGYRTTSNNISLGYENLASGIARECSQVVKEIRTTGNMTGVSDVSSESNSQELKRSYTNEFVQELESQELSDTNTATTKPPEFLPPLYEYRPPVLPDLSNEPTTNTTVSKFPDLQRQ